MFGKHRKQWKRAPVRGGHWRLRQLRQFDFGFQWVEDSKLRVVIPLPGIDRDNLGVKSTAQVLSISVKIREDLAKYSVRPTDQWEIILDEEVVPETAKAKYVEGVLLVDIDLKYPPSEVDSIEYE